MCSALLFVPVATPRKNKTLAQLIGRLAARYFLKHIVGFQHPTIREEAREINLIC
jgi:hypothetical protein